MGKHLFTYPFCYVPTPDIQGAAKRIILRINESASLKKHFTEGKMLGVLQVVTKEGNEDFLYAFSGNAGGKSLIEGFVPPIFDLNAPHGHYKEEEALISTINRAILQLSAIPERSEEQKKKIAELKEERSMRSKALQDWIFRQYKVINALGEESTIADIFSQRGLTPPGGTGECAAPKLLQYAYLSGMTPVAMGEFWVGNSPRSEVREQGRFYPSCTGKCGPLLTWMMKGLDVEENPLERAFPTDCKPEIVYEDADIIVVNKPSGMLSVPGKTAQISLLEHLQGKFGEIHSCHRLDMDTSGLMVFARSLECKVAMEAQFAAREVHKTYIARLVAGNKPFYRADKGTIALPLMLDYYDRPRQMVDREQGKTAITKYEVVSKLPSGETIVRFTPLTGRTHQLRVHAAHPDGLGHPIKGDRLYGSADGGRLCLHAESLEFTHPKTGRCISVKSLWMPRSGE